MYISEDTADRERLYGLNEEALRADLCSF